MLKRYMVSLKHYVMLPSDRGARFARAHLPVSLPYSWPHGCVRETGELIAIEVDSAQSFSNNTYAPGGHIIAQHRLLVARGWEVIHVPQHMWDRLDNAVRGAWLLQARRRLCCVWFRFPATERKQVFCPLQKSCLPACAALF